MVKVVGKKEVTESIKLTPASAPSPEQGKIYFDSTSNKLNVSTDGTTFTEIPSPPNPSQGDILYYDGTNWVKLPAGTSGQYLKTQGEGANPTWDDVSSKWQVVDERTITTDCQYVDFTNLDINTDKVYFLLASIRNPFMYEGTFSLYANEDYTETNYYSQILSLYEGGVGGSLVNSPRVGKMNASNSAFIIMYIIKDPNNHYRVLSKCTTGVTTSMKCEEDYVCKTTAITNLTSLRFAWPGGQNVIGVGSYFLLCKLRG